MLRLLLTGSRGWTDADRIEAELRWHALGYTEATLVHGACRTGADDLADQLGTRLGWRVERHPARWRLYGRRAGYLRNAEMVALGADVCLAFILNQSPGASMCADLAEKAGIVTHRFMEEQS